MCIRDRGAGGEQAARANLDQIINSEIRQVLGSVPSQKVLSEDRTSPVSYTHLDVYKRQHCGRASHHVRRTGDDAQAGAAALKRALGRKVAEFA